MEEVDDDIPELVRQDETGEKHLQEALTQSPSTAAATRIPVTILTGALGSGKSTLINYILTAKHEKRIAVIVNEFGNTGDIESQAMKVAAEDGAEFEEILELNNGCLCCSIKDRGIAAIESLMDRKGAFDYVLLETTGVADPQPIAQIFWQDDQQLANELYIDAVVCMIDAKNFPEQLSEADTDADDCAFLQQLLVADLIILNKQDLVSTEASNEVKSSIHQLNASADTMTSTKGIVDLDRVFHRNAYAANAAQLRRLSLNLPSRATAHLNGVSNTVVDLSDLAMASLERFDLALRELLWETRVGEVLLNAKARILRVKGLLQLNDGTRYVLQGVREIYDIQKLPSSEDVFHPKVVFIGRHLPDNLATMFREQISE